MKKPLRYHRNSLKESRPTDSDTSTPLMMIRLRIIQLIQKQLQKRLHTLELATLRSNTTLSGRSLGRSTGPVKKSGANKRTGGGKEHGECLGASSRTAWVGVDKFTVKHTPVPMTKNTKKNQVQIAVALYDQLLEAIK